MLPAVLDLQAACHALVLTIVHLANMAMVSSQLGVFKLVIRVLRPTVLNVMVILGYVRFVIMAIKKLVK